MKTLATFAILVKFTDGLLRLLCQLGIQWNTRAARCLLLLLVVVAVSGQPAAWAQSWQWAVAGGGANSDEGQKIALDAAGNSYITGYFYGTATFGSTTLTSAGYSDIYVAKLDPNGNYVWARQAGGTNDDRGVDIAVDASGTVAVTGNFGSGQASFGGTVLYNADNRGFPDLFVAQLTPFGTWQWAQRAGATIDDYSNSIAVDAVGDVVIAGSFHSSDYVVFGKDTLRSNGYENVFVAKLSRFGTWQWAKQAGGKRGGNVATAVAVDAGGSIAVTGYFYGVSATFGTTSLTNADVGGVFKDVFVARLSSVGTWQWARRVGDSSDDRGTGIAVDGSGNIVVTGNFHGSASFGATTLMTSPGSTGSNLYVARLNSGGVWQWATQTVSFLDTESNDVAVDAGGNVNITGSTIGGFAFGTTTLTTNGQNFVARLSPAGQWQRAIGLNRDLGQGIATDASGNATVTGRFGGGSSNFGTIQLTSNGGFDAFVAHINWAIILPQLQVYHRQVLNGSVRRTTLNYRATGAIKVAADNSAGTLFKVLRTGSQPLALLIQENATNTSAATVADITGYLSVSTYADSLVGIYRHPAFVDSLTLRQGLHVDVVDNTNPVAQVILASYLIQVVQPPLMLVHGIWSTGEAAFPDLKTRLVSAGLYERESQIRYADYPSDRAFAANAQRFIDHKNALLVQYAQQSISASKVDIVAHSQGGLLARQYIQDNTAYQQDVHKLITLNTPHSGSPMANFVLLLPPPALAAMALANHDPTAGAVEDLRYDGPTITRLNTSPDTKGVAIHALTTSIELSPTLPVQALLNGNYSYGGFLAGWAALTHPRAAANINGFLKNEVFRSPNDLVVGVNSQLGGLDSTSRFTTHFSGQWHSSGGTPAVQARMATLLRQNSQAANPAVPFTTAGFHPVKITSIFLRQPALPIPSAGPLQTTSTLSITAPTRNTLATDVDSLLVTVKASPDVTQVLLLCSTGAPQLRTRLLKGAGGSTYIRVPQGGNGRLRLTAFAFADSTYVQFDTLSLATATRATLTRVRVEPEFIYTTRGDSALVRVVGTYSDGINRTVLRAAGLFYSFQRGRARIGRSNWVIGLAEGQDSLRVTYAGQVATVPVEIASAASRPLLVRGGQSSTPEFQVQLYPVPYQQELTLLLHTEQAGPAVISLTDVLGRTLWQQQLTLPTGSTSVPLTKAVPRGGVYLVHVWQGTQHQVLKIVPQ